MGRVSVVHINPNTQQKELIPGSFTEAELLAGHRLDRRKVYLIIEGVVHVQQSFTSDCLCCLTPEGFNTGCKSCGYTKKTRCTRFHPIKSMEKYVIPPF